MYVGFLLSQIRSKMRLLVKLLVIKDSNPKLEICSILLTILLTSSMFANSLANKINYFQYVWLLSVNLHNY